MSLQGRINKIFSNVAFWHIVFWLINLSVFVLTAISDHSKKGELTFSTLAPTLFYFLFLAVIVYINYLILIPKFAAKRKVFTYILSVLISSIIVGVLFTYTSSLFMEIKSKLESIIYFLLLSILFIIITSFFKFFKDWVENQGLRTKILEIEKQKVEAELDTLKSQLNPHFLFNTLNNIYSHSLLKSDIAPSIVLKLSDLMSYILYDCKAKTVLFEKEIEFINNYIELEKVRLEKDIDVKLEYNNSKKQVPPLLFFPLIENSFKHGIGSNPKNRQIFLKFVLDETQLLFTIRNSKGKYKGMIQKQKRGGIGIKNVRKRLALLYPGTHKMEVNETEDMFEVKVEIDKIH